MSCVRKFIHRIWPFGLLVLIAGIIFRDVLFLPSGKMIYGGDIYDAYFFWKNFLRQSFLSGEIPFWNPYNFSGTPFLAHPNINLFYPPNWLFILFPPNISFSWYFFIHIIIAGTNMYLLSRRYADKLASLAASVTYAFGGFFMARIFAGHLEYTDAASWVPLVILAGINTINRQSVGNFRFLVIAFFIIILCGNELFLLFSLSVLFLYFLFSLFSRPKTIKKHLLSGLLLSISLALAFGMAAAEFLPRYEFIRNSIRANGIPYEMAASGSLPLEGLKIFFDPYIWGSPFWENYSYRGPWPNMFEYTHYTGIIPIFLILTVLPLMLYKALRKQDINKDYFFFAFVALPIFLVVSLGIYSNPNVHKLLYENVPLYKGIRFPARHLFLAAVSISVLTGISAGRIRNRGFKILLLSAITLDLVIFARPFVRTTPYPDSTFDNRLSSYLKENSGMWRVLPDYSVVSKVRKDFDFGAYSNEKIYSTSDYNSMVLLPYYDFIDILNKSPRSSIPYFNVEIPPPDPWSHYLNYLNIGFVVSDKSYDAIAGTSTGKFQKVLEGKSYNLYRNTEAKPRVVFYTSFRYFADLSGMRDYMLNKNPDITEELLVLEKAGFKKNIQPAECSDENREVQYERDSLNSVILKIKSECPGFISLSEAYYPGWKAKVNGNEAPLYRANYAFMAVPVGKGENSIRIYYYPKIFLIGSGISFLSIFLFGLSFFAKQKNKKI